MSSKKNPIKESEEEEEEEVEREEEVEEEIEEEDEVTNQTEFILPKTKGGLGISLELIKKFKEISPEESEDVISDFIKQKGLPMVLEDEETLVLILYFHKLCVPFYQILNSLN